MGKRKRVKLKNGTRDLAKPASEVSLSRPRWDQGADGPANRIGLVTEERGERNPATGKVSNPNGVKGARRVDMLEVYHGRGWITDRGYTAGEVLRDAWAATQRSRGMDWTAERVDSTPKPDATIDIQIDRVSRLVSITRCVVPEDSAILWAVVGEGRTFASLPKYRHMSHDAGKAHLRDALERLADKLEGRRK